MSKRSGLIVLWSALWVFGVPDLLAQWHPPSEVSRESILESSKTILGRLDIPFKARGGDFPDPSRRNGLGYGSHGV